MTAVRGTAIATPHHLATEAGAATLADGGTAVDAALTAAATLCVTYPNNVALGSDLVALVRSPDGRTTCVNATGPAARGLTLEDLRARHGDAMPVRGPDTITAPGAVRGWAALHALGGTRPWAELLAPAIGLARDGFAVPRSVAAAVLDEWDALVADPGCAALFAPGGIRVAEGETLRQPRLAETLEALANGGAEEFYTGALARAWVAGLQGLGSALRIDDLAAYDVEIGPPLAGEVGGRTILTSPPNTQGFSLIRSLAALDRLGVREISGGLDGDTAVALARVLADSNRARDAWLTDPRRSGIGVRQLVDPESRPGSDGNPRHPATGDTIGIAAVSADGWAVSLIQSVFHGFGACVLEPGTGILFQNRGTSFELDPRSPAAFAPGMRPPHTLMPVLVDSGSRLERVSATMGGQGQPQIHTQILLRAFGGASPAEAVAAPRLVVGVQDAGDSRSTVTVEADLGDAPITALEAAEELHVRVVAPHSELLGHANLVGVAADGSLRAAADPRSDGSAVVTGVPE